MIFCEGEGIAAARALIEATQEMGGLNTALREDVRMYYRVGGVGAGGAGGLLTWERMLVAGQASTRLASQGVAGQASRGGAVRAARTGSEDPPSCTWCARPLASQPPAR